MQIRNGVETMKSAAFASTTEQRGKWALPQAENPGPGTYDPVLALNGSLLPSMPDNQVSKVGRDSRFPADTITNLKGITMTEPQVGPGAYDPKTTNDGALDTMAGRTQQKADFGWSASFISDHIRTLWHGWFGEGASVLSA